MEHRLSQYGALACALVALFIAGCASPTPEDAAGMPASEEEMIAGMQIVDCLLPGQLRRLGSGTYLTARRPIKTTASDCNIRGGEYVAYDRADYRSALRVWMPAAEAGDANAQVNVGEIFEKGLGTEPNYEAAIHWYRKAAEQGNKRGLFNLGTMYEQGLGVEENRVMALNYYREAWGLPEDSVMFQETARQEREALEERLRQDLQAKESQVRVLERQIDALQQRLREDSEAEDASDAARERNRELEAELQTLTELVESLRDSRGDVEAELAALPKLRSPEGGEGDETASAAPGPLGPGEAARVDDLDFGRYYALVIGNRNYRAMQTLDTPINDARAIAEILEDQYGFQVQLMIDADRLAIMKAINDLHDVIGEDDNLLIYYAGHGSLIDLGKRDIGYWLPINADPPPNDSFWVPNEFITNHLDRIKARRVMVIADSCYGGLLSAAPAHLFLGGRAEPGADMEYLRYKLPRRARLLLSSGGERPVMDSDGGEHSIFAKELINVLRNNDRILTSPEVFASLRDPVYLRAQAADFAQEPEYKSIKGAGHEVGDFFFVPRSMAR